jgi:hypothetical protein
MFVVHYYNNAWDDKNGSKEIFEDIDSVLKFISHNNYTLEDIYKIVDFSPEEFSEFEEELEKIEQHKHNEKQIRQYLYEAAKIETDISKIKTNLFEYSKDFHEEAKENRKNKIEKLNYLLKQRIIELKNFCNSLDDNIYSRTFNLSYKKKELEKYAAIIGEEFGIYY